MGQKTTVITIIFIIAIATLAIFCIRLFSQEDTWICQNNEWVKHGNPSSSKPQAGCGETAKKEVESKKDDATENNNEPVATVVDSDIVVDSPKANDTVSSPLEIYGKAKGEWFFEAQFPIKILDEKGNIIAQTQAKALGDWMNEDPVPFKAVLDFSLPLSSSATLVLAQDDPSGQGNAEEIKIPITVEKTTGMKVKVYFGNIQLDPESTDCEKVFETERVIPKTQAVARGALGELLLGPEEIEKDGGFITSINSGVEIKKLSVAGGVARVDFSQELENGVGGACRVAAIRSQIIETLKQFPTIKSVMISVDGKTEGVLQP
jgi:hypothetical protein